MFLTRASSIRNEFKLNSQENGNSIRSVTSHAHPDTLNNLENCRAANDKNEEGQQPGSDRRLLLGGVSRGLGDVAALGDVLAVLLVGHADPLLGDHLRRASRPGGPSDALVRRSRAAGGEGRGRERRLAVPAPPPTAAGPGLPSERAWVGAPVGAPAAAAVRAAEAGGRASGAGGDREPVAGPSERAGGRGSERREPKRADGAAGSLQQIGRAHV